MIVALRALGLGDLLAAVPALRALRRAAPGERLVLAGPAYLAALARLAAGVDDVVPFDAVDGFDGSPLPATAHGARLAVNLHGRGPQSTALLASTRPERLVAFGVDATWRDDEHERDRWCRLLVESGVVPAADPLDLHVDVEPDERFAGAVVLHPGASSPARRWPVPRWAALARRLEADGRRVVVTGSAAERGVAEAVGAGEVVAGETDVIGLLALVAAADLVVCGDTGVAHVATAVATPSVVLFGPVPPERWGPPAGGPHVALWHGPGDDALARITVDEVADASFSRLTVSRR